MSVLTVIRQANQPGPPEHSLVLRLSAFGAVVVSLGACWSQQELAPALALGSMVLVGVGNVVSWRRRTRPLPFLKLVLALAVVAAFAWFITAVSGGVRAGDLASVEGPLAALFAWIQVTHAFDVPARRDLGFSLAGSATLMAVAAAQAIDTAFVVYVLAWAVLSLVGMLSLWGSMAGGARVRPVAAAALGGVVLVGALVLVAVLPAPRADSRLIFPSSLAGDVPLADPGTLAGGGPEGTEPAKAAVATTNKVAVGGLLGFVGPLDTALRGSLGNEVVMRVRADLPSFWLAETFNRWNGQSWTETKGGLSHVTELTQGPPFAVPLAPDEELTTGQPDLQTFYLAQPGPNLVFHAGDAAEVWFPTHRLYVSTGGTIVSGTSIGAGSVYTVASTVDTATPAQLTRAVASPVPGFHLPAAEQARFTELPGRRYPRVHQLALAITRHVAPDDTYGKVTAVEAWLGRHTRYTTDIPPLRPGQDTVVQFLFGTRRGYCEQISTSLAVMLRTLGIPAREAVGYVPGSYNPFTDLYEVEAKDAHAWVQVWFPRYGWQDFDPTADVPLANPSVAGTLVHDAEATVDRIPTLPTVLGLGLVALVLAAALWRRTRPPTWSAAVSRDLVAAARRAGVPVAAHDPLLTVAARLEGAGGVRGPTAPGAATPAGPLSALALATEVEEAAFGLADPDPERRRALRRAAHRLRRRTRRGRGPGRGEGLRPGGTGSAQTS